MGQPLMVFMWCVKRQCHVFQRTVSAVSEKVCATSTRTHEADLTERDAVCVDYLITVLDTGSTTSATASSTGIF